MKIALAILLIVWVCTVGVVSYYRGRIAGYADGMHNGAEIMCGARRP